MRECELREAVRLAAVCHIWEFNPQELSNAAWAFATLAVEESELLEAVRPAAVCKIWTSARRTWRTLRDPSRRRR